MIKILCFCPLSCLQVQWLKKSGFAGWLLWTVDLDDFKGDFCGEGAYPLLKTLNDELLEGEAVADDDVDDNVNDVDDNVNDVDDEVDDVDDEVDDVDDEVNDEDDEVDDVDDKVYDVDDSPPPFNQSVSTARVCTCDGICFTYLPVATVLDNL